MSQDNPSTPWVILALCTMTAVVVYSIPTLMIPVLFAEIAAELDLTVVQLGIAWGSISLSSIFVGIFGGVLGDRFGSKRTLIIACLGTGILGGMRGLAPNYLLLVLSFMLYGLIAPSLPPNLHKAGAHFFPGRRGISTATISIGFAVALFFGSRYVATWLSPLVGGWRNVMLWFGLSGFVFAVLWYWVPDKILPQPMRDERPILTSTYASLSQILRIREMWIVGIGSFLFWACFRGFTGYTPIYLRGLGWEPAVADAMLSNFFLASMILALPPTLLSDRLGKRRPFMVGSMLLMGGGVLLLATGQESLVLVGLIASGLMFDGFMSIHHAAVLDLKGIGAYTGSALGVLVMFRELGGFLSPSIGNWMAQFGAHVPFYFWGGLGLLAAVVFLFWPENKQSEIA